MCCPIALCARNVSRQLVRFVARRSLIWTCFVTLCSVASCFSCSSYVHVAIWFLLKTPASDNTPFHFRWSLTFLSAVLSFSGRHISCLPLVQVARACPSVIFQHLKRMLKDLTVFLEGPLPGVDVSGTVQPKHLVVSRTSLNTIQRKTAATGNNVLAACSQHARVSQRTLNVHGSRN